MIETVELCTCDLCKKKEYKPEFSPGDWLKIEYPCLEMGMPIIPTKHVCSDCAKTIHNKYIKKSS